MFHINDLIYDDRQFMYHKSWIKYNSFIKVKIYSYVTLNVTKGSYQNE